MLVTEKAVRDLVNRDLSCADLSSRLMAMRAELAELIRRWRAAGGGDRVTVATEALGRDARAASRGKHARAG